MTLNRAAGASIAVLLATTAGCGGAPATDSSDAGTSVRDSAGIEIVEVHGFETPPGEVWTLSGPALSIGGGPDDDRGLFDVGRIAPLTDGSFVVAHRSGFELVWFAPDGRRLAASVYRLVRGAGLP